MKEKPIDSIVFKTIAYTMCCLFILYNQPIIAQSLVAQEKLLNSPEDLSPDFYNFKNTYFVPDSLLKFDPQTTKGMVKWQRMSYKTNYGFDEMGAALHPESGNEFPQKEYDVNPSLPFSIDFVSDRTIRIRMNTGFIASKEEESYLMLVNGVHSAPQGTWVYSKTDKGHKYVSDYGIVIIEQKPWRIKIYDETGKLLTQTINRYDNRTLTPILPFSFVRRSSDYSRSIAASFSLSPDEKIYGCGESFTDFDKRGQRVHLFTDDAHGSQNEGFYKPIPFFMSNKGYGMFMHTSTPITCDFGASFRGVNTLMIGDDQLDLFIFLGEPKDILNQYTNVTGKSPMPPLWSFGLWMSRITYFSEKEGYDVAKKLRKNKIPTDVIHFDTGWFESDWRCDYQFAKSRFSNPQKMIKDLKEDGFHISLWQLPYFVPKNTLFPEIIEKGIFVKDQKGNLPGAQAVLDFTNPQAIEWYQNKISHLLDMGVGAIKVDFGEGAPMNGIYENRKTGFYEHNLYPLRYNKTVFDITKKVTGDNIIWARSAWAGSQRYPLHWGGDAGTTNTAMASTLRAGLSFGLSGFSFWSHDIGGFTTKTPENLYRRWLPFGLLSSHSRCHGVPPKEPWEYGKDFQDAFRRADNMRYRLMPYIYAQAKACTESGLPMVRALFVEFPDDAGAWLVDNEYLFGSDLLVAPLFEDNSSRNVYVPKGNWIDYQTGQLYEGGWHNIEAGEIPVIMLVRDGAVIPHIKLAQSTQDMDWSKLELEVFSAKSDNAKGLICLPSNENQLHHITVTSKGDGYHLDKNPLKGKTTFKIRSYAEFIKR